MRGLSLSIASDGVLALERMRDPVDSLRKKIQLRKRGKLTFFLDTIVVRKFLLTTHNRCEVSVKRNDLGMGLSRGRILLQLFS